VLTEHWSGEGKRWADSMMATVGQNTKLLLQFPWNTLDMTINFLMLNFWNLNVMQEVVPDAENYSLKLDHKN
jgi:hypothetical protein